MCLYDVWKVSERSLEGVWKVIRSFLDQLEIQSKFNLLGFYNDQNKNFNVEPECGPAQSYLYLQIFLMLFVNSSDLFLYFCVFAFLCFCIFVFLHFCVFAFICFCIFYVFMFYFLFVSFLDYCPCFLMLALYISNSLVILLLLVF